MLKPSPNPAAPTPHLILLDLQDKPGRSVAILTRSDGSPMAYSGLSAAPGRPAASGGAVNALSALDGCPQPLILAATEARDHQEVFSQLEKKPWRPDPDYQPFRWTAQL